MADGRRDWWRGGVIYEIYPRSFMDTNGDGVGDLPGIERRLDHVASLGVDAIWITPFFKSPMRDFGYDVADFRAVDPVFGTLDDFDRVVAKARGLGLKVLVDHVISHTSDEHPWFAESRASRDNPRADWYVWADRKADGTPPNNWLSVFGGSSWQWDTRRRQYYLHNFLASQPDLNIHAPAVQDAVLGEMAFWLARGVDGFRLDALNFAMHDRRLRDNPPAAHPERSEQPPTNPYAYQQHLYDKSQPELLPFLARIRTLLDGYGATASLAEVGDDAERTLRLMADYAGSDDKIHMCYGFDFLDATGPKFTPAYFRDVIERYGALAGDSWPCWAFSNHDCIRHAGRWTPPGGDPDVTARFAAGLLLALRGSICLYQGEELGLTEADIAFDDLQDPAGKTFWPDYKGRDGCRTPMPWDDAQENAGFGPGRPWLPVAPAHRLLSVARQERDPGSTLAFYRRALALRQASGPLRLGTIACTDAGEGLLVIRREHEGAAVTGHFNFGGRPVEARQEGRVLLGSSQAQAIEPLGFRWLATA